MATRTTDNDEQKAQEALELVKDLRETFKARNELYALTDRVLYLDDPVYIPPKYRATTVEVRTPLALHAVNTVAAALSVNAPEVSFDPVTIGTTGQENATRREHFFDASWKQQEQEARRRVFRAFIYSLVSKGEGVLKTMERRKSAWAQYDKELPGLRDTLGTKHGSDHEGYDKEYDKTTEEMKRALPYPISTVDVPPENFYYVKGESGFTCCVEIKAVPYFSTLQKYHYGMDSSGKICQAAAGLPSTEWSRVMTRRKAQTITMVEIWDCTTVRYLLLGPGDNLEKADGVLVHTVEHDYGDEETQTLRGPYFHAFGISTASRDVATMGLGIIFGHLRLYGLLNSLLTMQQQAAFRYAFTAYKRNQQPGYGAPDMVMALSPEVDDGGTQVTDVAPGDVLPWDISPIELGHAGVDLDKAIALVRQLLDLALPEVVQGVMADSSGYAISQAAHLARLIWDPIVSNAELCLAERVGFESWLLESQIQEPVYVFGDLPSTGKRTAPRGVFSMGPSDLGGVHRYRVTLQPDTPSNEVIKLRAIAEALQIHVMGPYQAITEAGNNPDEVEKEWLVHTIKQDPRVQAKLTDRVLAKLDIADQRDYGATLERFGGPPPGSPPGTMPPGAALAGIGQVMQPGQNGVPLQPPSPPIGGGGNPMESGPGPGPIGPNPVVPGPRGPMGGT